jgi:hypothetical protein
VEDLGERGDARELVWMVSALADKVEKEGKVVILNHHPKSFHGVEEAFRDPTVLRLVHPETMQNILKETGFREVSVDAIDGPEPDAGETRAKDLDIGGGDESRALLDALRGPRFYLLEAGR